MLSYSNFPVYDVASNSSSWCQLIQTYHKKQFYEGPLRMNATIIKGQGAVEKNKENVIWSEWLFTNRRQSQIPWQGAFWYLLSVSFIREWFLYSGLRWLMHQFSIFVGGRTTYGPQEQADRQRLPCVYCCIWFYSGIFSEDKYVKQCMFLQSFNIYQHWDVNVSGVTVNTGKNKFMNTLVLPYR